MSIKVILRTLEFKLDPSVGQAAALTRWLGKCCWLYNLALEQRTKAYRRRKEPITYNGQCSLLTGLRERIESVRSVPAVFARSALRRVDRGMKVFFRRVRAGEKKAGFPRFRSQQRFNSIEYLNIGSYIGDCTIRVPGLGAIRARGRFDQTGTQKLLRIVRRASGWHAQVLVERTAPALLPPTNAEVGIDLGLESFLATDAGEHVGNPRLLRGAAKKLRRAQQRLSRCRRGSNRRKTAVRRLARLHERVVRQRRGFAHRLSRDLVNRFDRIAVEDLNVKGLAGSRLAKSVNDAAWGYFLYCLAYKAECAGRQLVRVDSRGTSQECPRCGAVAPKKLSERIHHCRSCGFRCDRDQAAAMVIRQRAFRPARGGPVSPGATPAGSMKREGSAVC